MLSKDILHVCLRGSRDELQSEMAKQMHIDRNIVDLVLQSFVVLEIEPELSNITLKLFWARVEPNLSNNKKKS